MHKQAKKDFQKKYKRDPRLTYEQSYILSNIKKVSLFNYCCVAPWSRNGNFAN